MRAIHDIHGGIHPPENKTQSVANPIRAAGIPAQLIYPLSQHIGAPAKAIVEVGERVLKGQKIADANGYVSVPVHAASSGRVTAIEAHVVPHPSGMTAPCIVIEPDGIDEWIDHRGVDDFQQQEPAVLLQRIREAGIAGMGGAGFPTAVKLAVREGTVIDTLIINGTECEPYITADDLLMRERADDIVLGVSILRHIVAPTTATVIGIEDNKPEAIAAISRAVEGTGIEVAVFPTKYPSGGEKQLIQILTGREVPSGGLPADVGIVCQNVGTAYAVKRAVMDGEPLISRITTVTGEACDQQANFETLLGTPIEHLLRLCGFDASRSSRLIMGGPMMGFTLETAAVPVVKTTNCVLAPTAQELPLPAPAQACIRCGLCAEACPVSLLPQQLYWFARGKEYDKLEAHNLSDCIECGACSYVCPSQIPLVQYYRASKAEIRQQKIDAEKAEYSKIRFEARKARIEQQEAEKAAKRAARKAAAQAKAANASSDKGDAVQAAIERAKAKKAAVDPAQAAIEKAKARRAGASSDAPSLADLELALEKAEKRLRSATDKMLEAERSGSDNLPAYQTGVEKTQQKVDKAKAELAAFIANQGDVNQADSTPAPAENDAAQAAIARALAKREAASTMTDEERLQNAVEALRKRLEKAQAKLDQARAEDSDNIELLQNAVDKLQLKLSDAEQAYADHQQADHAGTGG